jgi:predicted CoA-binding protein
MNEADAIKRILNESKTIAVVGLSDKPERESFIVASYLESAGYEIIPINPMIEAWKGKKSYPDLKSAPKKIDVVDIFRRSEFVASIVEESINIEAKAVWMQLGVIDERAAKRAEDSGLLVVMDRCIKIEHSKFKSSI